MYRKRNFRLRRIHLQEEVYAEKTPVSDSRDKVRSEEEREHGPQGVSCIKVSEL